MLLGSAGVVDMGMDEGAWVRGLRGAPVLVAQDNGVAAGRDAGIAMLLH